MNVRWSTAANVDFTGAALDYEGKQDGLGSRFLEAVEETVRRIEANPYMWARCSPRLRRCLVRRFPFALLYQVKADDLIIVSVADMRRDPKS